MGIQVDFRETNQGFKVKFDDMQIITEGYEDGYTDGYEQGQTAGYGSGYTAGYSQGNTAGFADAVSKLTDLEVTENGKYTPQGDSIGFSSVEVNVNAPEAPTQEKTADITANGTTEVIADEGFALSKVTINTQIPDYTADEDAIVGRGIARYSNSRVSSVGGQAFYGCSSLKFVQFAKATSVGSNGFRNCSSLATAIFDKADVINANAFNGCSKLAVLILGGSAVCKLGASTSLSGTAITNGNGYAYVRPSLVEDTRKATNWATISAQIMPWVSTVDGLADIDGTTYNRACVWGGGEEYTEYNYNGSTWEEN